MLSGRTLIHVCLIPVSVTGRLPWRREHNSAPPEADTDSNLRKGVVASGAGWIITDSDHLQTSASLRRTAVDTSSTCSDHDVALHAPTP
ncbi:uncharacterized protein BDW47DRAFT_105616 [Aspergillus candidus]|uniref:Uncharacterized protein n=1 Tax=Aspergillus candidus TaxID=41067 RepID=A0A2I2FBH4_ASPCN|nr:hypothetical protein BDW47DRAFT_105616 [Aspergillus candidus]PLB37990.1 hypothetical protein BDW47DRAFT_105616 [Aspergillus candidus]